MRTHPALLPTKLTLEEFERTALETRRILDAAKATGDVVLMDYESEYLPSKLWTKTIKPRILKRDNRICRSCGGPGDVVHHRSYDRDVLEGSNDEMLVTVCKWCHNIIHYEEDGTKRSPADSDAVLFAPKPTEIPEPKIDMRRISHDHPPNKPRMTGYQHALWYAKARELWKKKRGQLDEAKRIRDAAKPPVEQRPMTWAEQREYRMK